MATKNELVQLGDFVLDTQQLILFSDGEELQAEPKIMELLVYLVENRERYVKLDELHQRVWAGRIISDTAVRNVINKLRNVLSDTDLADSRYIKSVPKRGYKLVCNVEPVKGPEVKSEEDELASYVVYSQPVEQILNSSGGSAATQSFPSFSSPIPKSLVYGFMALLVLASAFWFDVFGLQHTSVQHSHEFEQISHFPGEKYGLAASQDGRYLAFTGKTNVKQNSQVYLLDRTSGEIRQLTQQARAATDIAFVKDDQAIIYIDSVYGSVSLNMIDLTQPEPRVKVLMEHQPFIGRVIDGVAQSEIIFPLMQPGSSSIMLFSYNLETGVLTRFSSTVHAAQHDYMAAISPNDQQIAIARKDGRNSYLSIRDYTSLEQANNIQLPRDAINVLWQDDEHVLVLDSDSLNTINIHTAEIKQVLTGQTDLLRDVIKLQTGELVFVKYLDTGVAPFFVEKGLGGEHEPIRLFDVNENTKAMAYLPNSNHYLTVLAHGDSRELAIYAPDTKATNSLLARDDIKRIEIMQVSSSGEQVLLLVNSRVATFDLLSKQLTFHTTAVQQVSDVTYTTDGSALLYGEQVAGEWSIYQKPLSGGAAFPLFKGYRSVRVMTDGYILANTSGELFLQQQGQQRPLHQSISFGNSTRWYLANQLLVWSSTDYFETSLHTLDIYTGQYQVEKFKVEELPARFAISNSGDKILHKSLQLRQTNISKLQY